MEQVNSSRRPQQVPAPSNSPPPKTTPDDRLFTYQSGLDMFSGILSYAERTSPGVSSRVSAADFVALSSGLLHASGLSVATRRVNICSPDVVSTVLTAAGSSYAAVLKRGTGKAKSPAPGKVVSKKGTTKSSNASRKSQSSGTDRTPATTVGQKKPVKGPSLPLTSADAARRRLLQSCLRALKRAHIKPAKWEDSNVNSHDSGFNNMKNQNFSDFTVEQVKSAVASLSDEKIAKRDRNCPLLPFIGLVPKDSIDSEVARAILEKRNAGRASGASLSEKQKESVSKASAETPSSKEQALSSSSKEGGKQVQKMNLSKDTPKASTTSNPLAEGFKIVVRRVKPVIPRDDCKPVHERLVSAMHGLSIEAEEGETVLASGVEECEDLFFHFMDFYRSKSFASCSKMIDTTSGAPFIAASYKGVNMSLFFVISETSPRYYLVITNSQAGDIVSQSSKSCPGFRPSGSCMNVFPYQSPPRPAVKSTLRRTSDENQASTSSAQKQQGSSDPFAGLCKLSKS